MEKTKQTSKKEKPNKYLEKQKSTSFISDVKAFKENLKIRELLKTVKMNSSMRIKAPRGSKVMQNKDFNDNEDIYDDVIVSGGQQVDELPSATNTVLNREKESEIVYEESIEEEEFEPTLSENKTDNDSSVLQKSKSLSEGIDDCSKNDVTPTTLEYPLPPAERAAAKSRDRKLSLDHTMLLRREGLSQSEVDLNSIGKSPLERKSSFFRKKMDSFVRNTTEIFKRQSMSSKSTRSPVTSRRNSTSSRMSVSLQSLNEDSTFFEEFKNVPLNTYRDQHSSVSSLATPRTDSTLSINVNDRLLEQAEVYTKAGSPLPEDQLAPSTSTNSLNKGLIQDSLLSTRAISMSSGLDTATGERRRKTSRSNRVSWLASESLTDYFRRLIQDEKSKDIQGWHSYQDFSTIPENRVGSKIDSKGRRLSYMRAVSGEDPSLASSFRKQKILETEVPRPQSELDRVLAGYAESGIPPLANYTPHVMSEEAQRFVLGAATEEGFQSLFPRRADLTGEDTVQQQTQQAILQELVVTEAQYIQHLDSIVNVYLATAHALQNTGFLLYTKSHMVFSRIPDIFNSAMKFWELTIYPMLRQAKRDGSLLDPELIIPGLLKLSSLLEFYEDHMKEQTSAMEYLRNMNTDPDFRSYINWCNRQANTRLQLADVLIKPMQRLTKYSLIISRLIDNVADTSTADKLKLVLDLTRSYIAGVNRAVRQKEEDSKLDAIRIDSYEPEYRGDEEVEKTLRQHAIINLHVPMIDCGTVGRCLIHNGMMRYKDSMKEIDVHVLLFTDMMLICKKLLKIKEKDKEKHKKEQTYWKMLRPKIMLSRLHLAYKIGQDVAALAYVVLDELGSSQSFFQLSSKDGSNTLKVWESKIFEAMLTYTLTKWYVNNPPLEAGVVEVDCSIQESEKKQHNTSEKTELNQQRQTAAKEVEKRARERVAAMLHRKENVCLMQKTIEKKLKEAEFQIRLMALYTDFYPDIYDSMTLQFYTTINHAISEETARKVSEAEMETCSSTYTISSQPTVRGPTVSPRRRSSMAAAIAGGIPNNNTNTAPSKGTRAEHGPDIQAIFEKGIANSIADPLPSTCQDMMMSSYGCHEEPDPMQRSGSALDLNRPTFFVEDGGRRSPASMQRVYKIPENNQTLLPSPRSVRTPTVVLQESSPSHSPGPRSASAGAGSDNTLQVGSTDKLMHSMPDINAEIRRVHSTKLEPRPMPLTASERLYRSHQELMYRNRLAAGHYLKPDHRGSSYPPPSPRALQRGDAVSFSFRYPPLTRTKNVPELASASQPDSPRRIFGRRSPQSDMATGAKSPRRQRSLSPIPRAVQPPGEMATGAKSPRRQRTPSPIPRAVHPPGEMATGAKSPRRQRTPSPIPRAVHPPGEMATGAKSPRRQRTPSPIPRAVHPPGEMATGAKSPRRQRTPSPIPRAVHTPGEMYTRAKSPREQRSPSPIPHAVYPPGEKPEKRKTPFLRRSKDSQNSPDDDEYDADDDRSRRSSQEKRKQRVERSIAVDAGSSTTDDQDDTESQDSPKNRKNKD